MALLACRRGGLCALGEGLRRCMEAHLRPQSDWPIEAAPVGRCRRAVGARALSPSILTRCKSLFHIAVRLPCTPYCKEHAKCVLNAATPPRSTCVDPLSAASRKPTDNMLVSCATICKPAPRADGKMHCRTTMGDCPNAGLPTCPVARAHAPSCRRQCLPALLACSLRGMNAQQQARLSSTAMSFSCFLLIGRLASCSAPLDRFA